MAGTAEITATRRVWWCGNPIPRPEPFDHADWLFELKFDGFRAAADTVRGGLISRNGDRMRRFEAVGRQYADIRVFEIEGVSP
jgi:ATP-dependent DNA ligase